jgi:signal transduction histidine kinase
MFITKYSVNNLLIKLFTGLIFTTCFINAQNIIDINIKKNAQQFSENTNFYKASSFFLNNENDSTLIYSGRQLDEPSIPIIRYYSHYFRGVCFKQKRMFKEAESELNKIPHDFIFYPKILAYLGDIALEQNNFEKATGYFLKVKGKNKFEKFGIDQSHIIHNLGLCSLHLAQYKTAEEFLFESLKLQEEKKDTLSIIGSYMDIAGLYYEQYMDDLAIRFYEKAYSLSKRNPNFLIKKNASLNMAVVEENRKNYFKSLQYRKESEVWNDSLNNQSKIWSDAQLEKQLAVKNKQNEVNILKAQNKLKTLERNRVLYLTAFLVLMLLGGVHFYLQKIKTNKIILKQKTALDESNKTKDMLFSVVSHDLRSYINSLKNTHSNMLTTIGNKDLIKLNEQIRTSSAIADSTHSLLNNLLHWALMQTNQLYFNQENINISRITEQVVYNYQSLMSEKNIYFENAVMKNINVYADQESLKIVLRNLLDNAIKYTNSGGKIRIYDTENSDNFHSISIKDTGKGISAKLQRRILSNQDKVTTERGKRESLGLGLQLCRLMIEKNKGFLEIKSEENKGTQITISLLKGII